MPMMTLLARSSLLTRTLVVDTPKSAAPPPPRGPHHTRAALANRDIEANIATESLFDRSAIAGELELMFPLQLQRQLFEREGRHDPTEDIPP
jgi:hypothetical protein